MTRRGGVRRGIVLPLLLVGVACILWYLIFVVPVGNFWLKITISALCLAATAVAAAPAETAGLLRPRALDVLLGMASAGVLYGVFVVGKLVLTAILPGAGRGIGLVYAPRGSLALWLIGVLLLAVTGPAEEIFWRGFLQARLAERMGRWPAVAVVTALYGLVHVCTLNVPLILAALTAGLAWGALFAWRKSLVAPLLSHAVWGILIFVLFPVA